VAEEYYCCCLQGLVRIGNGIMLRGGYLGRHLSINASQDSNFRFFSQGYID
jgi:hypothetical protein